MAINVGGSSFNRGVTFVTEGYSCKFVMGAGGQYTITTAQRPPLKNLRQRLRKIPLLNGLSFVLLSNRLMTLVVVLALFLDFFPRAQGSRLDSYVLVAGILITAAIFLYLLKNMLLHLRQTWRYHGAEHKTIYAQEHGLELTLAQVRACPRVARRCGTNLAVLLILLYLPLYFLLPYDSLAIIIAAALAYELFDWDKADSYPLLRWLFKLGGWCQQHLVTVEPDDEQLLAAIAAMQRLLELENTKL